MMVAGVGCRRGVSAEEIEAAIRVALARLAAAGETQTPCLGALATLAEKAGEPGLGEAARRLAVPLIACSPEEIRRVSDRVVTRSARVEAAVGVPSVAEAAALVAAGVGARLRVARVTAARVTCAIAEGGA